MTRLLHYNAAAVVAPSNFHLAGMEKFSSFFKIFPSAGILVDRTGTIITPIRTTSLFPVPALRPCTQSYEDICNARARELLDRSVSLDIDLYVFWSGGIDSTLVLVSLLKQATAKEREKIVVLMSEESILENPNFYRDHIRRNLRRESSVMFSNLLGRNGLFVNGEHNDQLFGANLSGSFMRTFGDRSIHDPYARDRFVGFFAQKLHDDVLAKFYADLFERLHSAAPIELVSNHDVIWWFNFAAHWQSVYLRTLSYVTKRNRTRITKEYIATRYAPFYNTEAFQLWSMNNLDKRIKDTWQTYKWPCKDIIYEYTKDPHYRDTKTKQGSLVSILHRQIPFNFIDDSFNFSQEMEPAEYHEPVNDFV